MSSIDIAQVNKIYREYFELLDSYFGSIKHYLSEDAESHINLGMKMAQYPLISDLIVDAIDDIDTEITAFWKKNEPLLIAFAQNNDSLKCLYSGNITPAILENFVKKSALYIDTVIIPDPLVNIALLQKRLITDKKYYLQKIIRHVFNIWKLKDLILESNGEQVVLILPISISMIGAGARSELVTLADQKFTGYINKLFNLQYQDADVCLEALSKETTSTAIFARIKRPDYLPQAFRSQESLHQFLSDFGSPAQFGGIEQKRTTGWDFGLYLRSQFIRVQEHTHFCKLLKAEPIYDYELPWFFFNYELGGVDMDAGIANALQKEEFDWITNIPLSAIRVLRAEHKLDYMRTVLRHGITDLKARNDCELLATSKQIEKNLQEAFARQKHEIKNIQKQVRTIIKKDIPIIGSGFLAGLIPYVGNIVSLLFAGRDIGKALEHKRLLASQISSKKQDFISLLIKSHERN